MSTVDWILVYEGAPEEEETEPGQWYWQGRASNNEIVTRGEGHPSYNNALRAARGAHPHASIFKLVNGEKVSVGVHATDRYSEIKSMLGIPDSEPIFILRAQDNLAAGTIEAYREFGGNNGLPLEWLSEISDEIHAFENWAEDNPDKMKLPD